MGVNGKIAMLAVCLTLYACGQTPFPGDPIVSLAEVGTHYVDSENGNDQNAGTDPSRAWKTLGRATTFPYQAGMKTLFRRGQTFRGTLVAGVNAYSRSAGTADYPVVFGAYGEGAKPLLISSVEKSSPSDWISEGGRIWRCATPFSNDAGNILFIDAAGVSVGTKKWSESQLSAENDFWYDVEAKRNRRVGDLKTYSRDNPGSIPGRRVEIAVTLPCIALLQAVGIAVEDLDLRYSGRTALPQPNVRVSGSGAAICHGSAAVINTRTCAAEKMCATGTRSSSGATPRTRSWKVAASGKSTTRVLPTSTGATRRWSSGISSTGPISFAAAGWPRWRFG